MMTLLAYRTVPFDWLGLLWFLLPLCVSGLIFWIGWRWDPSKGRSRCPKCWYPLAAAPSSPSQAAWSSTCPECGRAVRKARQLARTRRHKGLIALACLTTLVHIWFLGAFVVNQGPLWPVPSTALFRIGRVLGGPSNPLTFSNSLWEELNKRRRRGALSLHQVGEFAELQAPHPLLSAISVPARWITGRPLPIVVDSTSLLRPLIFGLSGEYEILANGVSIGLIGKEDFAQDGSLIMQAGATNSPAIFFVPTAVNVADLRITVIFTGKVVAPGGARSIDWPMSDEAHFSVKPAQSVSDLIPPSPVDLTKVIKAAWKASEFEGGLTCEYPDSPALAGVAIGVRIELRRGNEVVAVGRTFLPNTPKMFASGSARFVRLQRQPGAPHRVDGVPKTWSWVVSSDDDMAAIGDMDGCTARWIGSFSTSIFWPPSEKYLQSFEQEGATSDHP